MDRCWFVLRGHFYVDPSMGREKLVYEIWLIFSLIPSNMLVLTCFQYMDLVVVLKMKLIKPQVIGWLILLFELWLRLLYEYNSKLLRSIMLAKYDILSEFQWYVEYLIVLVLFATVVTNRWLEYTHLGLVNEQ